MTDARSSRRSLQLALPQVPLLHRKGELPGLPPSPLPLVACKREGGRLRVVVVSGGKPGTLVQFPDKERADGRRWTVETLVPVTPRRGCPYYRAAGEIRRLEVSDEQKPPPSGP